MAGNRGRETQKGLGLGLGKEKLVKVEELLVVGNQSPAEQMRNIGNLNPAKQIRNIGNLNPAEQMVNVKAKLEEILMVISPIPQENLKVVKGNLLEVGIEEKTVGKTEGKTKIVGKAEEKIVGRINMEKGMRNMEKIIIIKAKAMINMEKIIIVKIITVKAMINKNMETRKGIMRGATPTKAKDAKGTKAMTTRGLDPMVRGGRKVPRIRGMTVRDMILKATTVRDMILKATMVKMLRKGLEKDRVAEMDGIVQLQLQVQAGRRVRKLRAPLNGIKLPNPVPLIGINAKAEVQTKVEKTGVVKTGAPKTGVEKERRGTLIGLGKENNYNNNLSGTKEKKGIRIGAKPIGVVEPMEPKVVIGAVEPKVVIGIIRRLGRVADGIRAILAKVIGILLLAKVIGILKVLAEARGILKVLAKALEKTSGVRLLLIRIGNRQQLILVKATGVIM